MGSLFPVVAGLVASEPGDDGMGKRLRSLLKRHKGAWQQDLVQLFAPDDVKDPVTAFACRLLGGKAGDSSLEEISRDVEPLSGIDAACANFMINLMQQGPADSRIACIRRLAIGAFFAGTMRLVSGVVTNSGSKFPPAVFVYCGLPPGIPQDPLVRAAGKSFAAWIQNSHSATIKKLSSTLSVVECLPKTPAEERFRQQLQIALHDSLGTSSDVEEIIKHVTPALSREGVSFESCKQLLESREVGFTKSELTRRVRSLGSHIGFAGPTRGLLPRLLVDTPLLGVLTRGVVGSGTMSFDDFVTRLHTEFGIVVGLGADDSVADALGDLGTEGFDTYEMLITNQQLLRERMIRTGLARTYSDSHTEVFSNV